MIPAGPDRFGGIFASTVAPMDAAEAIDWAGVAAHAAACGLVDGVAGLLCNGHAGENAVLTSAEKRRVVAETVAAVGRSRLVVAGVNAEASLAAAQEAEAAAEAGADAILLFPPNGFALTGDPAVILRHHRAVADAVPNLPLYLFAAHGAAGGVFRYPPSAWDALLELPSVVGIKEGGWEVNGYDALRRRVAARRPDVAMLASGDEHLLACMAHGSAGSMVSLAAIVPELVVALDAAMRDGDLTAARVLHERLEPLAQAIYGDAPAGRATPRLKWCLHHLGRIATPACRAPVGPATPEEAVRLASALAEALHALPPSPSPAGGRGPG